MLTKGKALADVRRAIIADFGESPGDIKLAVDEASIGKSYTNLTYQIQGLDACVDATIQYAAQQGQLTNLLTTLTTHYNSRNTEALSRLAKNLEPLSSHAVSLDIPIDSLESIILKDVAFEDAGIWSNRLADLRRAVCRVEPQPQHIGLAGYGTGFLVCRDVVITCAHVASSFWNDHRAAESVRFRFDYEKQKDGTVSEGTEYRLAQNWMIHSCDRPDFALLRIICDRSSQERRLPIPAHQEGLSAGHPLMLLQHPRGEPLKLLFGEVSSISGDVVRYEVNTEGGSSGSPCLSSDLRAVGVHFAGGNQAYSVSSIRRELSRADVTEASSILLGETAINKEFGLHGQSANPQPEERSSQFSTQELTRPTDAHKFSSLELYLERLNVRITLFLLWLGIFCFYEMTILFHAFGTNIAYEAAVDAMVRIAAPILPVLAIQLVRILPTGTQPQTQSEPTVSLEQKIAVLATTAVFHAVIATVLYVTVVFQKFGGHEDPVYYEESVATVSTYMLMVWMLCVAPAEFLVTRKQDS